jgi:23S rRNA pseudouridine1911/1915/1917 synthase
LNTSPKSPGNHPFILDIDPSEAGLRLDAVISTATPACSRSHAARLIREGHVRVNAGNKKPGYRVKAGDRVEGALPPPEIVAFDPEPMDLAILYEDRDIIVVNKPPGLVVHPAPGNYTGTLVNGLLHHCPDLAPIAGEIRPGIVHRLDKDTSGTLIVAKNAAALENLAGQFKARTVSKLYLACVYGNLDGKMGKIDLPVGRHPTERKKMSVASRQPRQALTLWKVTTRFGACCLLEIEIKTGRTHQIRVHCAAMHHPIIGDGLYGGRTGSQYRRQDRHLDALARGVERQLLHAWRLSVDHPGTGERMTFESPVAADMQAFIDGFEKG